MQVACQKFAEALYEFMSAIYANEVQIAQAAKAATPEIIIEAEDTPVQEAAPKRTRKPKPLPTFEGWLERVDAEFRPMIDAAIMLHFGQSGVVFEVEPAALPLWDDAVGAMTDDLRAYVGKEAVIEYKIDQRKAKPAKQEEKPVAKVEPIEEVAEKQVAVSADDVKRSAVMLATKLKSKDRVVEIIKSFGANRVDEIAPAKYPALKAALDSAAETSPQGNGDGF